MNGIDIDGVELGEEKIDLGPLTPRKPYQAPLHEKFSPVRWLKAHGVKSDGEAHFVLVGGIIINISICVILVLQFLK